MPRLAIERKEIVKLKINKQRKLLNKVLHASYSNCLTNLLKKLQLQQ